MDAGRLDQIERFLDGTLGVEDMKALRVGVRADADLRNDLASAMRMHGLLAASVKVDEWNGRLAAIVHHAIGASRPRFASRVMRAVRSGQKSRQGRARRVGRAVLALGAAAGIVLAAAWYLVRTATAPRTALAAAVVATVTSASNGVSVVRAGIGHETRDRLKRGDALRLNDRIETGAGRIGFEYAGEQTRMEVKEHAGLRLTEDRGSKRVFVERGEIGADVAKQPDGKEMVFVTPQAEARVLGTKLSLTVKEKETQLEVKAGVVRMTRLADGAAVDVQSGQGAGVAPGLKLEARDLVASRSFKTVFFHEFDAIGADQWTDNELVRLQDPAGQVTAVVSRPCQSRSPTWNPDAQIQLSRAFSDDRKAEALYAVPQDVEVRIRIKSDRPGKWGISHVPTRPRFKAEHFYTGELDVGTAWRETVLHGEDMKPYRIEGHTRDLAPGMEIGSFVIVGFGAGRLYVDRYEVRSLVSGVK
jgi:hypothetical protein